MPIFIPDDLSPESVPYKALVAAGLDVRSEKYLTDDSRVVHTLYIENMPNKVKPDTTAQWGRLFAASGIDVHITFAVPDNTAKADYGDYPPFSQVKNRRYDLLHITGAPLETKPFDQENVKDDNDVIHTWKSLKEILSWSRDNVITTHAVCFAGAAALYLKHGVDKEVVLDQHFGVHSQQLAPIQATSRFGRVLHTALGRFEDQLAFPVSRSCQANAADVAAAGLQIITSHKISGPGLIVTADGSDVISLNHGEYDAGTLGDEDDRNQLRHAAAVAASKKGEEPRAPARPINYDDSLRTSTAAPPWHEAQKAIVKAVLTHVQTEKIRRADMGQQSSRPAKRAYEIA